MFWYRNFLLYSYLYKFYVISSFISNVSILWKEFSRIIFDTVQEPLCLYVMQLIRKVKDIWNFQFGRKIGPSFFLRIQFFLIFLLLQLNKLNFKTALYSLPFDFRGSASVDSTNNVSKIFEKIAKTSKKQNLPHTSFCLHSICFVFTTIYMAFPLCSEL